MVWMQYTTIATLLLLASRSSCAYSGGGSTTPPLLRAAVQAQTRRSVLGFLSTAMASSMGQPAQAASSATEQNVYFGVGCFWHIQHEFVQAERDLLGRSDSQLTSRTGYAGGTRVDKEGRVCYHNFQGAGDYGKMGHGEVVGMRLSADKIPDFAQVYFDLFRNGKRVDPQDKGGEYRSLIGLPGGTGHAQYAAIEKIALSKGMTLEPGKGNDGDTLKDKKVYVYDTAKFPFYQAEVYHQYHDDFQSPAYGKAYNDLANLALEEGRIKGTGCPDRV